MSCPQGHGPRCTSSSSLVHARPDPAIAERDALIHALSDVSIITKRTRIQEVMVRIQLQTLYLILDCFVAPEEQAKERLRVRVGGDMLSEVVRRKGLIAGGLDGWCVALFLSWFASVADILRLKEEDRRWPEGLLDAQSTMIGGW